jgi:hypothetical protein
VRESDRERAIRYAKNPPDCRERSGLPKHFSDDECEAYCWLKDCGFRGWMVDLLKRSVTDHRKAVPDTYANLIEFAANLGRTS